MNHIIILFTHLVNILTRSRLLMLCMCLVIVSGCIPALTGHGVIHIDPNDADGDGFRADEDCNDTNSSVHPGAEELCDGKDNDCDGEVDEDTYEVFPDEDGDGFGDESLAQSACDVPEGYTLTGGDCDDGDPAINPGASEVCGDGTDNDCDPGNDDEGDTWYVDADNDGYGDPETGLRSCDPIADAVLNGTDCDDANATVNPGASENVADGIDQNCDGFEDCFEDSDGDGYGSTVVIAGSTLDCSAAGESTSFEDCDDTDASLNPSDSDGDAWSTCDGDCNDGDVAVSPGEPEVCGDGIDNDCDPTNDATGDTWYADTDGDGFGDPLGLTVVSCDPSDGYVTDATDCNDTNALIYPGAIEWCNGTDDDCDGLTDEAGALDELTWYADADGDGFGDPDTTQDACEAPSDYVSDATDCDDSDPNVHPDADEMCDGVDNNCDGSTDASDAIDASTWYHDDDGDGFGDLLDSVVACSAPGGYVSDNTDCDDTNADLNRNDSDSDGASTCDGDCDDFDASLNIDDADADGVTTCDGDCDDLDATSFPQTYELWIGGDANCTDGVDNDCDGDIDGADWDCQNDDGDFSTIDIDGNGLFDDPIYNAVDAFLPYDADSDGTFETLCIKADVVFEDDGDQSTWNVWQSADAVLQGNPSIWAGGFSSMNPTLRTRTLGDVLAGYYCENYDDETNQNHYSRYVSTIESDGSTSATSSTTCSDWVSTAAGLGLFCTEYDDEFCRTGNPNDGCSTSEKFVGVDWSGPGSDVQGI